MGEILDRVAHYHPTFFFLCIEGLSTSLKNKEMRGDIHGVKVCRGAPTLSHLLFVDDCFLFCRVVDKEITILKEIPHTYGLALGQLINYQLSKIKNSFQLQHYSTPKEHHLSLPWSDRKHRL